MKDLIIVKKGGIQIVGNVASKLQACGFHANSLRPYYGEDKEGNPTDFAFINVNGQSVPVANATLRKDEWKHYDKAVLKAKQTRLRGIADLEAEGLVYDIPGMSKMVLEYETESDISPADLSMDANVKTTHDRPNYEINYLPLPIISKDFTLNARVLNASRETGQPLDTSMIELATRKVVEKAEEILFVGASSYAFGGGTIQGYMDKTGRNTTSLTANWDDSAATGAVILADVLTMKQALIDARMYGPYALYIPTNFETAMEADFKANGSKSIRERVSEVDGIDSIRVSDKLTADNVIMVQLTSDVVRLVRGMDVTLVEWESNGGMTHHFKVMAIMVPQLRADAAARSGLVHAS